MSVYEESLELHEKLQGKIEVVSRAPLATKEDLSLAYTPGVAAACKAIEADYDKSFDLTRRGHMVAVITDGSAVLGLGDIGPAAGMPVMEGKCALFKAFGDVDAFPICVDTHDVDEMVRTIALISKSFGGINLEDIAAPRCFEVEEKLKELVDIPVFHDDQHGTAIVVAAAMINAFKLTGKNIAESTVVVNGCGAAGSAITRLLLAMGWGDVIVCDRMGILDPEDGSLNAAKLEIASITNKKGLRGTLADAMSGADAFIGVSTGGVVNKDMVASMNEGIVFALANPEPEIYPEDALAGGARVVGTGRSDFPNQINNVLVFPGIFKGALAARASEITMDMQVAAAQAIAGLIPEEELTEEHIIVSPMFEGVADAVAQAVMDAC